MNKKVVVCLASALIVVSVLWSVAEAQTCTPPTRRAMLIVNDNGTDRDTLWFGHDATATRGIDPSLCEIEFPPPPPLGVFDARFVNGPGEEGLEPPAGMGQGSDQDYRSSAVSIDTLRAKFQPGAGGYPMTFTWTTASITAIFDSCWLMDEFGGIIVKARMHVVSQLVVASPAITSLFLVTFGPLTSVDPISNEVPSSFALLQNYPNPFNPETRIRFAIQNQAMSEIAVYDVLGRKLATLVSENLAPGTYETTWNGTESSGLHAASGVYFVRMTADAGSGKVFSAMQKIMMVK
jgi:hypothetical protein